MRILGIDYGESKVGLALGDDESGLASPYKIFKNSGWQILIRELVKFCQQEKIGLIVLGLPVNSQVNDPKQADRVKEFSTLLSRESGLEIKFQDERFTSQQAQKVSGNKPEDDIAAALILQAYLDSRVSSAPLEGEGWGGVK